MNLLIVVGPFLLFSWFVLDLIGGVLYRDVKRSLMIPQPTPSFDHHFGSDMLVEVYVWYMYKSGAWGSVVVKVLCY